MMGIKNAVKTIVTNSDFLSSIRRSLRGMQEASDYRK